MSNRTLMIIGLLLLGSLAILLVDNLSRSFGVIKVDQFLEYDNVKSVTIIKGEKNYKFNLDQQDAFIKLINNSRRIGKKAFSPNPDLFDFDSIEVEHYKGDKIAIKPINMTFDNYIFLIPEWNPTGYIEDTSNGKLKRLISEAHE